MNAVVRVLCRPEVCSGFGLVGLQAMPAATAADAAGRLRTLVRHPGVGVVLIEQSLHDALSSDLQRSLMRRPLPMVVPFPGPQWVEPREGPEAYIVELLRQVIGYRVKLR